MTITADLQNSIDRAKTRAASIGLDMLGDAIEFALERGQWPSELFRVLEYGTDAELEAFKNLPITNGRPEGWPFKD
jgi:hypothetical protein